MKTGYFLGNSFDHKDVYDYAFFSPPCYEDLYSMGVTKFRPETYKTHFLDNVIANLRPTLGTFTVSFTGDRRSGGRILMKDFYLKQSAIEHGYYLRDAKYAKKTSGKYNAYSHQLIHIYTFQSRKIKGLYNLTRAKLYHSYGVDVWGPFAKEHVIDGEVVGQPTEIAHNCIHNFTDSGHIVYDPFAGVGSTLAAARTAHRQYLGYELRESIWKAGMDKYGFINEE